MATCHLKVTEYDEEIASVLVFDHTISAPEDTLRDLEGIVFSFTQMTEDGIRIGHWQDAKADTDHFVGRCHTLVAAPMQDGIDVEFLELQG